MRCFTACSGSWKCKKTIKRTHLQDQCLSPRDEINEAVKQLAAAAAAATKSRKQDQIIDSIQFISESNEEQHNSIKRKKNTFDDLNDKTRMENENMKAEKKSKKCNDEGLDSNANDQDLSMDNNNKSKSIVEECSVVLQPESSESLFSLSIDSRRQMYGVDIGGGDKEVSSILKENISIVSNEIDKNPSKYEEDKENEEPQQSVEEKSKRTTMKLVEISVDTTSLSSWLVVSDKLNECSSSPSCSVDGGIGTVGSYLQHTDQAPAKRMT